MYVFLIYIVHQIHPLSHRKTRRNMPTEKNSIHTFMINSNMFYAHTNDNKIIVPNMIIMKYVVTVHRIPKTAIAVIFMILLGTTTTSAATI